MDLFLARSCYSLPGCSSAGPATERAGCPAGTEHMMRDGGIAAAPQEWRSVSAGRSGKDDDLHTVLRAKDWDEVTPEQRGWDANRFAYLCRQLAPGPTGDRWLPLHTACWEDAPVDPIRNLLVGYPEAVREVEKDGWTPLHLACKSQEWPPGVIYQLVAAWPGACAVKNNAGSLPIHLACQAGAPPAIVSQLLAGHPAAVDERDDEGRVPLDLAREFKCPLGVIVQLRASWMPEEGEFAPPAKSPLEEGSAEAVFNALDVDKTGTVEAWELLGFRSRGSEYGLDGKAVDALFEILDTNHDGEVSLDEFLAGWETFTEEFAKPPPPRWIDFQDLATEIGQAQAAGLAVLVVDPSERSSRFLTYQGVSLDAKGLFILDAVHGKDPEEIKEEARFSLVQAIRAGSQLHLELAKSAPAFGDFDSEDCFPATELMRPNFGRNMDVHEQFVKEEEKEHGVWVSRWRGHNLVVTSHFSAEEYRQYLLGAWEEWPLDEMAVLLVTPPAEDERSGLAF